MTRARRMGLAALLVLLAPVMALGFAAVAAGMGFVLALRTAGEVLRG